MLHINLATDKTFTCPLSQDEHPLSEGTPSAYLAPEVVKQIQKMHPNWQPDEGLVCAECVDKFRANAAQAMLEDEKGTLTEADIAVVESIRSEGLLTANLNEEMTRQHNIGARLADKVTSFVGSWWYVRTFIGMVMLWIGLNSLANDAMDNYPFPTLRLILACVVALQASIILISQRRIRTVERQRAENDYRINLKAELEIRDLNDRIDQMILQNWELLNEIRRTQRELLDLHAKNTND